MGSLYENTFLLNFESLELKKVRYSEVDHKFFSKRKCISEIREFEKSSYWREFRYKRGTLWRSFSAIGFVFEWLSYPNISEIDLSIVDYKYRIGIFEKCSGLNKQMGLFSEVHPTECIVQPIWRCFDRFLILRKPIHRYRDFGENILEDMSFTTTKLTYSKFSTDILCCITVWYIMHSNVTLPLVLPGYIDVKFDR